MGKIIIRGNFTIETEYEWIKNMRQPLESMELEVIDTCPMFIPVKCHRMKSVSKISDDSNKEEIKHKISVSEVNEVIGSL